jgi:hypothetical protein
MKKLSFTLVSFIWAVTMVAQMGLTCENPIPVDKNYKGRVEAGDELWYTAWTYDLPLHVYFSPDIDNSTQSPELMVDFTCDPGVYTDHKLDSVLKLVEIFGIAMPVEFRCDKVVRDGKVEWDLSIDERYRDQLTEYGLTNNVQAFVRAYFPDGGEISLTPDQSFQNCMENGHYVHLGDTIDIAANDTSTMLVMPFSEWKNDSIRFVWIGEKSACVWVAEEECQFTPTDASVYIKAKYDLDKNTVKKLYTADMQSSIDNWIGKGIFYGKVLSDAPGKLVVERIPLGEIQGGAILLKHGQSVKLAANDERVFCFPKGWNATELVANTEFLMAMHVSATPDFQPGDANVLTVYPFSKDGNRRLLQLTTGDFTHWGASVTDDYLYVRFVCNSATTMTPNVWNISTCVDQSILISSGKQFSNSLLDKAIYRIAYTDWASAGMTISWSQRGSLPIHLSSFCDFKITDPQKVDILSVPARGTLKITQDKVDSWSSSIDENGFLYIRFNSTRKGDITFTSSKPAEVDPEIPVIPTDPCVINSIEIKAGDQLTLNLDSAFTIYRIEYAAWKDKGISLSWTGTTDLHTFVAETCTFAVAPYNKYVHVYVPVQGEHTLDAAAMADLAEYVDENGYLYVRFLTEKEGVLTVK